MKKTLGLFLAINFIVILIGCSNTTENVRMKVDSSINSQKSARNTYTKDGANAAFKANKEFDNYEITDSVLVSDNKIPMLKAVISFYNKKENNSCNLAFIYGDSSQEICFAVNEVDGVKTYEINDSSQLAYIGNGTVTTSIRKIETNEVINYKISFSYDGSRSGTNFEIVSDKPKTEELNKSIKDLINKSLDVQYGRSRIELSQVFSSNFISKIQDTLDFYKKDLNPYKIVSINLNELKDGSADNFVAYVRVSDLEGEYFQVIHIIKKDGMFIIEGIEYDI